MKDELKEVRKMLEDLGVEVEDYKDCTTIRFVGKYSRRVKQLRQEAGLEEVNSDDKKG